MYPLFFPKWLFKDASYTTVLLRCVGFKPDRDPNQFKTDFGQTKLDKHNLSSASIQQKDIQNLQLF